MKRKLLFITFLMLFCSTMFGQFTPKYSYTSDGTYDNPMTLSAVIEFDGEEQINPNLELGVFCGDELRGGAFVIERNGRYYARPLIYGQSGQFFTFKVYDHTTGIEREWSVGSTFTYGGSTMEYMSYNSNGYGNFSQPAVIDFVTPNYWNPEPFQFNFQVTAVILKDGVEQTDTNLELGAFSVSDGTVRGSVKLYPQTILGNTRYYAYMLVGGTSGEEITFKLYDHGTRQELQFNDVNTCILTEDDDATGNPILGSYIKPFEVNFITAPYVAQIDDAKYTSFEAALTAAVDYDEITLLEDVTLAVNPTVVSKDININVDGKTVTGTIELANTGATVTCAEGAVTVTTNVAGYKVVYEDGMYKLVAKNYVAQVGDVKYESIQEAVDAAQAGNEIVVIAAIDGEDVVVDKNVTIRGSVTLNDVSINAVEGASELTVSGLSFTGNSWINSGAVSKLTVTGVSANVTPSNATYTNSRSAFISLGRSEGKQLELIVTDCNIVANGGGDAILGWAAITNATLTGNTFGSETAYQTNSDCVKFMAIADGAVFNITGNTIYSNYNGIVFGQNTTRDNAYTVNVNTNNFYGDADHIWIEVSGSNTTHATIKATSDNKVNGIAFTANDIKLHPNLNTFTSYAGVDVVLDVNGKVLGGTFKYVADGVIADGYEKAENNDGTYGIIKSISGKISYRAYVNDTETREGLGVDLENIVAKESVVVKLYDANGNLLTTTTYRAGAVEAPEYLTCNIVLWGNASGSWETTIHATELTVANVPDKIELIIDGQELDTFENALGEGTNVDETAKYKALDCVLDAPVAKVGNTEYYNINNAIANWTNNTTLTLLADVTLSDVITLKSTEHHILNLSTYTMTAAAGKNAIEIKCNGLNNATYALTVNADTETPGGITAEGKACIYYKKTDDTKDRPIICINNGVFEGSYSINSSSSNGGTNCPQFWINGGTFKSYMNLTKAMLITKGGYFDCSINCTGDVSAYRLISGGTFKNWQFMTAGPSGVEYKFTVGKTKNVFDCGVYVDDNGFLVVGGDVITEAGTRFKASSANYSGWSTYLQYSSAATKGLYYTSVEEALADNNKTTSSVNIYVSELDLTGTSYKGTLVITEPLTVTFAEGTTPAWKVASGEDGHEVGYTESVENGVVTRVYTLFTPVAQVGEVKYETLEEAFAAAQEGETITMLDNVTEVFDIDNMANVTFDMDGHTLTGAITPSTANMTIKNGKIDNDDAGVSAIEINNGSLTLNNDVVIESARHALRIDGNVAVTINGGEYKAAIGNGTGTYHALNVSGTAVVTIVDGTFVGPKGTSADSGAAVNVQTGATVSISGGNFSGGKNNTLVSKGTLTLTGGTYDQDVNVFCADGYAAITNDNATWTVIEALTRNLEEGWNWFSSYVVADAEDVQEALGENGLQIKSQLGFSQYIEYNGMKFWDGTITENPSVGMYMIKTSQAHEMTLVGNHVDPSQTPITIHPDWTWIAYPMTVETNISDAIDFTPEVGDQIKGRNGFAYYFGEHTGWGGEINTLVPGHGYMYHSIAEDTKTLKYSYPQAGSRSALKTNVTSENNHWVADAYKYANNMTMLATVDVEGGDYEVAAFVNGEVRGSSRPIYVESLDTYMLFLTIHGDEVEEMTFKMYDLTTGEEYAFDNRMNYSSDAIVGSIEEPYMLTCATLGIGETSLSEINIYPNPTTIGREINLGTECEMVEVFNTLGAKVAEYQNVDRIDAFETAGVYVIRVTDNNEVKHCRLVVK